MKLALCTVYHLAPEDAWLAELQLDRLRRTEGCEIELHATLIRSSPAVRALLEGDPLVVLHDTRPHPIEGVSSSREHAHHLTQLLEHAAAADATHLGTLDPDAFPIHPGWACDLAARLTDAVPLAAVFRAENGDTWLPHPSGAVFRAGWYRAARPWLGWPRSSRLREPEIRELLARRGQAPDVGIGWAIALERSGLDWWRLRRSNHRNLHYLLAGIYGHAIFHLNAVNRPALRSRGDQPALLSRPFRGASRVLEAPRPSRGALEPLVTWLERLDWRLNVARQDLEKLRSCHRQIVRRLRDEREGLVAWLGGD